MVKNKPLRIALIVLCVCLIVSCTVIGLVACSPASSAYADSSYNDLIYYANFIDLCYTGVPGLPFLYNIGSPTVNYTGVTSASGSFSMENADNELMNNSLSYYFLSNSSNFSYSDLNGFRMECSSFGTFTLNVDFGTGYTLPGACGYYGFSCHLYPYGFGAIPSSLDVPFDVVMSTSKGDFSFNGHVLFFDSIGITDNTFFSGCNLGQDDIVYAISYVFTIPANKKVSLSNFRLFLGHEAFGYPYHYATSILPTGLSTDAYNNGKYDGLAQGRVEGFAQGQTAGYAEGYQSGYQVGLSTSSTGSWYDLFSSVFNAPIDAIFGRVDPVSGDVVGGLFNLTIPLGGVELDMRQFFIGIVSCLLVVIGIRIIIKFI